MMRPSSTPAVLRRSLRLAAAAPRECAQVPSPPKAKRQLTAARKKGEAEEQALTSAPNPCKKDASRKSSPSPAEASMAKEESLWSLGFNAVCGVDEAGRGPLAGPVVAAACILPRGVPFEGLRDSKKLSEAQREQLFREITTCPGVYFAIEVIEPGEIDRINILQATFLAMEGAVGKLSGVQLLDYVLIDGNQLPRGLPEGCKAECIIKGDVSCRVISAASVLAKVTRDRLMAEYDRTHPAYGFKEHKGYGTRQHMAALLQHGPCPIHRRSFAPMKHWSSLLPSDSITPAPAPAPPGMKETSQDA